MRSPWAPFLLAAAVTVLIGIAVSMEPYFAGDVSASRGLQSAFPNPSGWATPISRVPTAPLKYYVMAIAAILAFVLAGWKGLLIVAGAVLLDQYGAEHTKQIFGRPRPSRDLIAVTGNPAGFSFPSTTITFFCATFGVLAILALRVRTALGRFVLVASSVAIALGCLARVVLGAHWPSDVGLTVVICLSWIWATARVALPGRAELLDHRSLGEGG